MSRALSHGASFRYKDNMVVLLYAFYNMVLACRAILSGVPVLCFFYNKRIEPLSLLHLLVIS